MLPGIVLWLSINAQTKSTENIQQLWFGYFNQTRVTKNWGLWTDLQLRTKEDFANKFSQAAVRVGVIYYI